MGRCKGTTILCSGTPSQCVSVLASHPTPTSCEDLGGSPGIPQVPGEWKYIYCLPYPLVPLGSNDIRVENILFFERERGRERARERSIDFLLLLFYLFMHSLVDSFFLNIYSLVDSYMYPDQGSNRQPWCMGMTL